MERKSERVNKRTMRKIDIKRSGNVLRIQVACFNRFQSLWKSFHFGKCFLLYIFFSLCATMFWWKSLIEMNNFPCKIINYFIRKMPIFQLKECREKKIKWEKLVERLIIELIVGFSIHQIKMNNSIVFWLKCYSSTNDFVHRFSEN